MKRALVAAALVVALVVPAQAAAKAKVKHFAGTVAPSGAVSFKVGKKRGEKGQRISAFTFTSVPVNCADGPHTTTGRITFPARLRSGNFTLNATSSATGATVVVHGSLSTGTIDVAGNVPLDGTTTNGSACDSGLLHWTASRI